ncbi:DUF29 family protein [Leptodesmis sp.]|uniref:DUF29 family protein n=1 Tax=Leptodesmis sp. TaxID=3100501 RepID=UPI0040535826
MRKGYWTGLDVDNLIEELEALGRSEQQELGNYLQLPLMHLLKCQYQPERQTTSCRGLIQTFCLESVEQ